MNTRKANFKKLRLPSTETNNGPRNGRRKATSTISEFFLHEPNDAFEEPGEKECVECPELMPSPIEYSQPMPSPIEYCQHMPSPIDKLEDEPRTSTRTKLKTFIPKENRMKATVDNPLSDFLTKRQSNDFEVPAKTIKPAPKTKAKAKPRPKRQQKIKSAFFKNEELFSEVTAQHCLVDNINPDEMQMALALSRSEAELSGSVVIDKCKDESEGIRDKLKRFGFQVTEPEDYNYAATYKLTKTKNKWASKFTSLTLRNPSRQLEKVNQKIEEVLKLKVRPYESPHDEKNSWIDSVQSLILLPLIAANRIIQSDSSERSEVVDFYVLSLFEPSRTKAGYLLKDMRRIPGRDLSPINKKTSKEDCIVFERDSQMRSPATKRSRIDKGEILIESLSCPNMERYATENVELIQSLPSTISMLDVSKPRRRKIPNVLDLESEKTKSLEDNIASKSCKNESISNSPEDFSKNSDTTLTPLTTSVSVTSTYESEMISRMPLRPIRATSPDIFADSDVEMETDEGSEMEKLKCTSSEENIETYEIFSSNEVKTSLEPVDDFCDKNANSLVAVIDLTQQESETSSQNSERTIAPSGPFQPFQKELDGLLSTSLSSQVTKFEEEPLTTSKFFKDTDCSFNSNKSNPLDKSSDSRNKNCFSFGSSASEDSHKSSLFKELNGILSVSLCSKLDEEPSTNSKSMKDADFSFNSNKSNLLEKSYDSRNKNCFSFGSSASEDSHKSSLFKELNGLLSASLCSKLNEEPSTSSKSMKDTDFSFNSNKSNLLEKSSDSIRNKNRFSFGSSASEDFHKSSSFNKSQIEDDSIDLTQNYDQEIDCIELSDDEVNYSIWKADKSMHVKDEKSSSDNSPEPVTKEKHEFSFVDLVAATQPLATQSEDFEPILTGKSRTSSVSSLEMMDLSKRSDFGILEEQSPFKTPTKTPKKTPRKTPIKTPTTANNTPKCRRALSESFLGSPMESSAPLKRFTSSNKFKAFTNSEEESFSDLDDIDKLIYGSPSKKVYKKPTGLTQLLTGAINEKIMSPEKSDKEVPQEFEFNERTYLVKTVDVSQRPNFATMDESALLDRLYRYGIKPLKRKQAETILEYIYNQTHPCLVDESDLPSQQAVSSDGNIDLPSQAANTSNVLYDDDNEMNEDVAVGGSKFNFKDCWGQVLVSDTAPSMEIKGEQYIFQTNKSKKISTALLPLHIAWHNLLKSSTQLHEAILYFEPIDLQEVYLFFKGLGYRYDPKEMKCFFDSRSIIFRYDVKKSDPSAGANRHVRKKDRKENRKHRNK